MLPPPVGRKRPKKKRRSARLECPEHRRWVKTRACCVAGCGNTNIDPAHVRLGSHAPLSSKPDDSKCISLCRDHHNEQHRGEASFAAKYSLDLHALAAEFAAASPYWGRFLKRMEEQR